MISHKDNQTIWQFDDSLKSSLTIFAGALQSNRTYQFKVNLQNLQDSSLEFIGYLLVQVQDTRSHLIDIELVI